MTTTLPVPAIADPIYYVNMTPSNLLGATRYLPGLRFITSNDCFAGRWDRVAFTSGPPEASLDVRSDVARLLDAVGSENRVPLEQDAHALFLLFDERAE